MYFVLALMASVMSQVIINCKNQNKYAIVYDHYNVNFEKIQEIRELKQNGAQFVNIENCKKYSEIMNDILGANYDGQNLVI